MKARDVMSREVAHVDKDERLEPVLDLMRKRRLSKLVVVERDRLAGVVTTGDIADELGALKNRGVPASHLHVSSAMRRRAPSCGPESEMREALRTMLDEDAPLLPVVQDDALVGVVTLSDVLRHVKSAKPLSDVMTTTIHAVAPTDRVVHARRLMIDHRVERLPVLQEGRVAGIVGESDVAWGLARFKDTVADRHQPAALQRFLVEDVQQAPVVTASPEATLQEAAARMLEEDVGCLPVVRGDRLVGIVTRSDLAPYAGV